MDFQWSYEYSILQNILRFAAFKIHFCQKWDTNFTLSISLSTSRRGAAVSYVKAIFASVMTLDSVRRAKFVVLFFTRITLFAFDRADTIQKQLTTHL